MEQLRHASAEWLFGRLSSRFVLPPSLKETVTFRLISEDSGKWSCPSSQAEELCLRAGETQISGSATLISVEWIWENENLSISIECGQAHFSLFHDSDPEDCAWDEEDEDTTDLANDCNVVLVFDDIQCQVNTDAFNGDDEDLIPAIIRRILGLEFGVVQGCPVAIAVNQVRVFTKASTTPLFEASRLLRSGSTLSECESLTWSSFFFAEGVAIMLLSRSAISMTLRVVTSMHFSQWQIHQPLGDVHIQMVPGEISVDIAHIHLIPIPGIAADQAAVSQKICLWSKKLSVVARRAALTIGNFEAQCDSAELVMECLWESTTSTRDWSKDSVKTRLSVGLMQSPEWLLIEGLSATGVFDRGEVNSLHALTVPSFTVHVVESESTIQILDHLFHADDSRDSATASVMAPFATVGPLSFQTLVVEALDVNPILPAPTQIKGFEGNESTTIEGMLIHYGRALLEHVRSRTSSKSDLVESTTDSMSIAVGRAVGKATVGAGLATPVGLAASVGALAAKDSVKAAVSVGKISRGASSNERYRFGDFTRGAIASFRSKPRDKSANAEGEASKKKDEQGYMSKNKGRYAGAVGANLGAVVGLTLIGGPVGFIAGSVMGGSAARGAVESADSAKGEGDEGQRDEAVSREDGNGLFERPALPASEPSGSLDRPNSAEQQDKPQIAHLSCASLLANSSNLNSDPLSAPALPPPPQAVEPSSLHPAPSSPRLQDPIMLPPPGHAFEENSLAPPPPHLFGGSSLPPPPPPHVFEDASLPACGLSSLPPPPSNVEFGSSLPSPSGNEFVLSSLPPAPAALGHLPPPSHQAFRQPSHPPALDASVRSSAGHFKAAGSTDSSSDRSELDLFSSQGSVRWFEQQEAQANNLPIAGSGQPPQHTRQPQHGALSQRQRQIDPADATPRPYQFGDLARGVIARGKKARGGDGNSSYKFGDFTRGLFS